MPSHIKYLLAAIDGSEPAERALDVAVALARATGGTLSIMTVAATFSSYQQEKFRRAEGDIDPAEAFGNRLLRDARERVQRAGIKPVKSMLCWGDPAETIIDTIAQEQLDAIVIGRRGRGQLSGLLLGSVSQKLVSLAPCVVIVVP